MPLALAAVYRSAICAYARLIINQLTAKIGLFALVLLSGAIAYLALRYDRQVQVERLVNFAERDPRSGFRLPILLSLSALSLSNNTVWMMSTKAAIDALENRLSQSPRDAGTFPAFGFDTNRNIIAWIDKKQNELFWCDLGRNFNCIGNTSVPSRRLPKLSQASVNSALANMPLESVGFVSDLDGPIMISKGILYYWQNNDWKTVDLDALLGEFIAGKTGFLKIDIVGGGIRVQLSNWIAKQTYVEVIGTNRELNPPFEASGDALVIEQRDLAGLAPTISQNGKSAASVTSTPSEATEVPSLDECYGFKGRADTGLGNKTYSLTIWQTAQRPLSMPLCVSSLQSSAADVGLGYANDDPRNLALLFQRPMRMRVFRASDPTAEAKEFAFDSDFGEIFPVLGAPYGFSPIAATRLPVGLNGPDNWAFAWQTPGGVRVAQQVDGGNQLVSSNADRNHIRDKFLYGGPGRAPLLANRMDFSADGRFLIMQVLNFPEKQTSVFIWDITTKWHDKVVERNLDDLKELACRIAAFDPSNQSEIFASYNTEELLEWKNNENAQPCQK
jgi:hypothetical protein